MVEPSSSSLSTEDASLSMEERLRRMVTHPRRRQRGQIPMEQVQQALLFQREYVPKVAHFDVDSIPDLDDGVVTLQTDARQVRELRQMRWEDHAATCWRDDATQRQATQAKKLARETAMLAQLNGPADKCNMAIELRLSVYLRVTLTVCSRTWRLEYLHSRNGTGQTPLHRACRVRDAVVAQLLLDVGADIGALDDAMHSAFHVAIEVGAMDVYTVLLRHLSTNTAPVLWGVDREGYTLLHAIAMQGRHEMLASLRQTIDSEHLLTLLNATTTRDGLTALHIAAQRGHFECLKVLLHIDGINASLRTSRGANVLHLALQQVFNIDAIVQAVLDGVAPQEDDTLDAIDEQFGHSALHKSIIQHMGAVSLALINSRRVSLITATRDGGWSPLHLAIMTEQESIVRVLLERGAMVDMVDNDGQTPLLLACLRGRLELIRLLLAAGANPAHQNKQSHCALHYLAAFCRDRALLTDVILKGADVNAKSLKLNTPLHFAAMQGNDVAAQVLLTHGANPSSINEDRRSVVYLAKKWKHPEVEKLVKPPQVDNTGSSETTSVSTEATPMLQRTEDAGLSSSSKSKPARLAPHRMPTFHKASTPARVRVRIVEIEGDTSENDNEALLCFDDDEDESILMPSTPWPVQEQDMLNNQGDSRLGPPCRSFSELQARFMPSRGAASPVAPLNPLNPLIPPRQQQQRAQVLENLRSLQLDPAFVLLSETRSLQAPRHLLTTAVEVPWELTIPIVPSATTGTNDSALQRQLKPCIRTNIAKLRHHLAHVQPLNWPQQQQH